MTYVPFLAETASHYTAVLNLPEEKPGERYVRGALVTS